jgi:hypothetical protein
MASSLLVSSSLGSSFRYIGDNFSGLNLQQRNRPVGPLFTHLALRLPEVQSQFPVDCDQQRAQPYSTKSLANTDPDFKSITPN